MRSNRPEIRGTVVIPSVGSALVCTWVQLGEKYQTIRFDTIFMEVPVTNTGSSLNLLMLTTR
jgi:hypothetical protein